VRVRDNLTTIHNSSQKLSVAVATNDHKGLLASPCVHPSMCNNYKLSERIVLKFDIWGVLTK